MNSAKMLAVETVRIRRVTATAPMIKRILFGFRWNHLTLNCERTWRDQTVHGAGEWQEWEQSLWRWTGRRADWGALFNKKETISIMEI